MRITQSYQKVQQGVRIHAGAERVKGHINVLHCQRIGWEFAQKDIPLENTRRKGLGMSGHYRQKEFLRLRHRILLDEHQPNVGRGQC